MDDNTLDTILDLRAQIDELKLEVEYWRNQYDGMSDRFDSLASANRDLVRQAAELKQIGSNVVDIKSAKRLKPQTTNEYLQQHLNELKVRTHEEHDKALALINNLLTEE